MKRLYIAEQHGTGSAPFKIVSKDAMGADEWMPATVQEAVGLLLAVSAPSMKDDHIAALRALAQEDTDDRA